jgi:hypothetical protein
VLEESKDQRGNSSVHPKQRSIASVNDDNENNNEKYSLMIPKYQKKIMQRLEKIIEERKQSGDSGERSPYRMKLTALDNSCVMFTINPQTPPNEKKSKCT